MLLMYLVKYNDWLFRVSLEFLQFVTTNAACLNGQIGCLASFAGALNFSLLKIAVVC